MSNYFNTLNLRQQLAQLGKCRFMNRDEFATGCDFLKGKKVVIIGCGAQGLNQGLNMRDSGLEVAYALRAEAIAERERTQARLEGRRAELVQQLELAWRSVEIARVRVQALSEGAVRAAEAALRVAEAAYRFGERGILEVIDAQRVLRAVRQDLLLARFQLQSSLIELDTLAGRYAAEQ